MKENEEWDRSEWQGRSENQVKTNAQISGCLFLVFTSGLVCFVFIKFIIWLFEIFKDI